MAKRIISIILASLNAAFWLAAAVFFVWPLGAEAEKMTVADWFINNLLLVFSVAGLISSVLLLLSVILYNKGGKAKGIKKAALICSAVLYILTIALIFFILNMNSTYGKAADVLLITLFSAWLLTANASVVLLIIGFIKSRKRKQKPSPTGEG